MGLRAELAAHLSGLALEVAGERITVYPTGAEVVATPAAVLFPSDPYQAVATQGPDKRISIATEIVLVANRIEPGPALDMLEDMRKLITDGLKTFQPTTTWAAFGGFGSTSIGEVEYATATIELVTIDSDRGATL
jgi:hypothetical protein